MKTRDRSSGRSAAPRAHVQAQPHRSRPVLVLLLGSLGVFMVFLERVATAYISSSD
jgi:hypothetical protein